MMAKRREVDAHFDQRGYAKSGDAYNKAIYEAEKADNASYGSTPALRDPVMAAQVDDFTTRCAGCCDGDDPEEGGSCCIIS